MQSFVCQPTNNLPNTALKFAELLFQFSAKKLLTISLACSRNSSLLVLCHLHSGLCRTKQSVGDQSDLLDISALTSMKTNYISAFPSKISIIRVEMLMIVGAHLLADNEAISSLQVSFRSGVQVNQINSCVHNDFTRCVEYCRKLLHPVRSEFCLEFYACMYAKQLSLIKVVVS